jgi:hypothetical protein
VVLTSRMYPWFSIMIWPKTFKVNTFEPIQAIDILHKNTPINSFKTGRKSIGTQMFAQALTVCTLSICRLHSSYWSNGSCGEKWKGRHFLDEGRFPVILRLEATPTNESSINLPTGNFKSSRCPTQAGHCCHQETTGRKDFRLKCKSLLKHFKLSDYL